MHWQLPLLIVSHFSESRAFTLRSYYPRGTTALYSEKDAPENIPVALEVQQEQEILFPETKEQEVLAEIKTEIPIKFSRDEEYMMVAIGEAQSE